MAQCFDGGKKLVRILDSQQACALDGRIPRRSIPALVLSKRWAAGLRPLLITRIGLLREALRAAETKRRASLNCSR